MELAQCLHFSCPSLRFKRQGIHTKLSPFSRFRECDGVEGGKGKPGAVFKER